MIRRTVAGTITNRAERVCHSLQPLRNEIRGDGEKVEQSLNARSIRAVRQIQRRYPVKDMISRADKWEGWCYTIWTRGRGLEGKARALVWKILPIPIGSPGKAVSNSQIIVNKIKYIDTRRPLQNTDFTSFRPIVWVELSNTSVEKKPAAAVLVEISHEGKSQEYAEHSG